MITKEMQIEIFKSLPTSVTVGADMLTITKEYSKRLAVPPAPEKYPLVLIDYFADTKDARNSPINKILSQKLTPAIEGAADAGCATTYTIDADRTEEDDYWNGATIRYTSGANAGQRRLVTDFIASEHKIVHEAFDSAPAEGDTYVFEQDWVWGMGKRKRITLSLQCHAIDVTSPSYHHRNDIVNQMLMDLEIWAMRDLPAVLRKFGACVVGENPISELGLVMGESIASQGLDIILQYPVMYSVHAGTIEEVEHTTKLIDEEGNEY